MNAISFSFFSVAFFVVFNFPIYFFIPGFFANVGVCCSIKAMVFYYQIAIFLIFMILFFGNNNK